VSRPVRSLGVLAPGEPGFLEAEEPEPGEGEAWVRTLYSGVSAGTEVSLVRGTDPHHHRRWDRELRSFAPVGPGQEPHAGYPVRGLGYMEVARVEVSRTPDLPEGELVACAYGHRTGRTVRPGRDVVVPLPRNIDPVLGIYAAQMGPVAVNGLLHAAADVGGHHLADGVRGRTVLVTGAGVVGLLTALLAAHYGAADVVVADATPGRRQVAERLGLATIADPADPVDPADVADAADVADPADAADAAARPAWLACKERWEHGPGDHGADVVFQCRGQDRALATALKALRPQGTVVDLAFYQGGAPSVHLGEEFHHNGLTLRSAQIGRVPRGGSGTWPRRRLSAATLDLLYERGPDVRAHLVTDLLPFAEGPALLRALAERRAPRTVQAVLAFGPGDLYAEAATVP
jgi:threonine dehydrogenase-like Zn-dependent dehydrogenase